MHSIHLFYSTPVVGGLRRAPQPTYKQGCLHLNFAFTMHNSRSAFCFIPQITTEPTVPLPMQQWSFNNAPLESVRLSREYVLKILGVLSLPTNPQCENASEGKRERGGEGEREREGGRPPISRCATRTKREVWYVSQSASCRQEHVPCWDRWASGRVVGVGFRG